jgi:EAL domain-containing protein (putative c-di-GMP-specific phosphodiesterase class I)
VSPAEFIPIAEETGLILPLGRWVLGEAARQGKIWIDRNPSDYPTISVNLSAKQFQHPTIVEEVARILAETGLPPACLTLEITETAVMDDAESNRATLQRFKDLGVRLAIDDFGSGYSSLGYLKRFPVDMLKIDRAFIGGLGRDPEDTAIVEAVTGLASMLGMQVTAEGVETADQADRVRNLGCTLGQGFYFATPLPPGDAQRLIEQDRVMEGGAAAD